MKNKEIFKNLYNSKINKDNNYKEIIKKIDKENNSNFNWSFIPVSLVIFICIISLINNSKINDNEKDVIDESCKNNNCINLDNYSKEIININKITKISNKMLDIKYENINIETLSEDYNFISKLYVPINFKDIKAYKILSKHIDNNSMSKNYDNLINYSLIYNNEQKKQLIISFSKTNEPVRDYYFSSENSKVSKINNKEIFIYQYEKIYMTKFNYNNIYFDIETQNINEEEFLTIISSIVR